eukprot:TRINITY_DN51_c0_g1_i1.p1 TRINITY_DN51_c0_g1~~TRINITY_DN51_c0_g1_i1.p1  ORF type:complete len:291 (+),score=79.44 TRINITY_DN51_c0_g1_i1:106-978(+)
MMTKLALLWLVLALFAHSAQSRTCVFLHGCGLDQDAPPTSTFPDYWGNVHTFVPQCNVTIFNHHDTVLNPWYDDNLMRGYCQVATGSADNKWIQDTIVFTHSMGNLILAGAIASGYCDFDLSSSWYQVTGPMHGSRAADMVDHLCADPSIFDAPVRAIAKDMNYCRSDGSLSANPSYVSMQTNNTQLIQLDVANVMAQRVKGSMCGSSAFGLMSSYSLELYSLSEVVGYPEPNDGMVGWSSCAVPGATYSATFQADFYQASINHADATCRNGDGDYGDDRKPCSWFSGRL